MSFPLPVAGQLIRYAYLWSADHARGQEEGAKDRPCAVVMVRTLEDGNPVVMVLPVTHTPPADTSEAVEIPPQTKQRLGLDTARSWIVCTEANRFVWPGPDLRPAIRDDASTVVYGVLPAALFRQARDTFLAIDAARKAIIVSRTE